MKTINKFLVSAIIIAFLSINLDVFSQVGIGTITPDVSSMLDVTSTTKGMLAPRMTTAQKTAITTPASGLLVYDTDLGKYCYFNGSSWITIEANIGRDNYVLVKSLADLPTAVAGVITLNSNWNYEINGAISIPSQINLNGAEISGLDHEADQLIFTGSGDFFIGIGGGAIERLTITTNSPSGKTLFNLNDATKSQVLKIRDAYIMNFASIGTIAGYYIVYMELLGFMNNTNGITYDGVEDLFLIRQLWFSSNTGTYTKLQGSFDDITIAGGLYEVSSGSIGLDVTAVPTLETRASISPDIIFSGLGTHVAPVSVGSTFSFTKEWEAEAVGIRTEKDDVATGTLYISSAASTSIGTRYLFYKVSGTTTASNLFRFDTGAAPTNNYLRYMGSKTRKFIITGSYSILVASGTNTNFAIYVAKNGAIDLATKSVVRTLNDADIVAGAISGSVELAPGDYIEIFVSNESGTVNCTLLNMNVVIR